MQVQIHLFPMSKSLQQEPRINLSSKQTLHQQSINQMVIRQGGKFHRVAVW